MPDTESHLSRRRARRPFATLRKESSAEDNISLYKERRRSIVPLSSSPFIEKPPLPEDEEPEIKVQNNELKVYVAEIPWSDLLLEIAMTTAFASLTCAYFFFCNGQTLNRTDSDGTPILEGSSVASYLAFFALVWWVWVSQVAYNVRFRQSDWLHRFFVFLQLLVFCGLAAFTNSFDITEGISNDSQEQTQMAVLQLEAFATTQDISVSNYRSNRIPAMNARGISIFMGLSRIVLLAQYLLTLRHVPREDPFSKEPVRRDSFYIHIGSIAFSGICYFTAYLVVGHNPSEAAQIAKLVLWYLPLLVEVAAHFVAQLVPGRVRYKAEAIYERTSTVFIIILGGGLDKITDGFQYIVGNISIGFQSASQILCAGIIFILLFTLYFGSSEGDKLGSKRALALFFFQFFYLSALIVTLQGIAAMLNVGNIGSALSSTAFEFLNESTMLMESKGFGVRLNESDYSATFVKALNKTGVPLYDLVSIINDAIDPSDSPGLPVPEYNTPYGVLLQEDLVIITTILKNFNAYPSDGSLLSAQINAFSANGASNTTIVNNHTFHQLAEDILTMNARPALWFYSAGGSVLFVLALMCLINRWPRDKYEWGRTISRIIVGSLIIAITALDIHASDNILTDDYKYEGSRIWYLATHAWVLPPYALALFVEQMVELALLYMAARSYHLDDFTRFFRVPRLLRQKSDLSGSDGEHLMQQVQTFDLVEAGSYVETPPDSAGLSGSGDTAAKKIMNRYRHASIDSAS